MKIADIYNNDVTDGVGFCVSVWTQGCPNRCKNCQNPQTWDPTGGYEISLNNLIKQTKTALIANGVQRNLSLLGGEPLAPYNRNNMNILISSVREDFPSIKIYLWTGYTYEYLLDNLDNDIIDILSNIDYLIDGPYIDELRDISLPLRGSKNQRILAHEYSINFKDVSNEF